MSIVQTEHVLVVPTQLLHDEGHFQGFSPHSDRYLERLLRPEHMSYRPRDQMEQDPSYKQLIPYMIVQHRDAAGAVSLFHYTRGKGQGEQRLHAKVSIGIGGHICAEDAGIDGEGDPYLEGMRRELDEELVIETPYSQRCVGLINDDETEVGRVHLGVVHILEVEQPQVRPREADILDSGFRSLDQLRTELDRMETWSSICLQAIYAQ